MVVSKSKLETKKIAKEFLQKVFKSKNSVVGLYGELGTGKTAFTQFVAKNLGVKSKITSPTFVIMKKYPLPLTRGKQRGFKFLYHFDMYRLKNEKELNNLSWPEIIADKNNLVFVEWPENVKKIMPKHHKVKIYHTKKGYRKIHV
ncbi:MAG TPA: tRNA (adenosine(37)-N6)-threonylcarbamoyltransferase complex ATPase subunit type 1 TsaE [Candidatus Paceibacterota bacterium]